MNSKITISISYHIRRLHATLMHKQPNKVYVHNLSEFNTLFTITKMLNSMHEVVTGLWHIFTLSLNGPVADCTLGEQKEHLCIL